MGGMKCGGCQAAVTKALQAVDGASDVTVALDPGSAVIKGSAPPGLLIAAVESTGKTASLLGGASKDTAPVPAFDAATLAPISAAEQLVQLVNCACLFGWIVVGVVVSARLSGQKVGALVPLFPTVDLGDGTTVWCSGALALNEAGQLDGWNTVSTLVVALELLCCVEVIRMLVGAWPHESVQRPVLLFTKLALLASCSGSLRGNVILGVGLHYTRLFVCLQIFPLLPDHGVTYTVLLAWAVTEVARYPFYISPSPFTAAVRYACPVVTFPVGAGMSPITLSLSRCLFPLAFFNSENNAVYTRTASHLPNVCMFVDVLTGAEAYACFLALQMLDPQQSDQQLVQMLAGIQIVVNTAGGIWAYPPMVYKALNPKSKNKAE